MTNGLYLTEYWDDEDEDEDVNADLNDTDLGADGVVGVFGFCIHSGRGS